MWKSLEEIPITRNRTDSLAGNKNSHGITQSVIAKNRSASKLIHHDQEQRSNKRALESCRNNTQNFLDKKEKSQVLSH